MQYPGIFFIIARGRSGTDLLANILNHHPHICVAPEALFIINLRNKYKNVKKWTIAKFKAFYNDIWLEQRITKWWSINKEELYNSIINQNYNTTFQELCKLLYIHEEQFKQKEKVMLIGDKNPTNSLFIFELLEIFPDAKFIHLVRDYRDNILSFQNLSFDLNNTCALAERWIGYNKIILKFKNKYPEKIITLKYEDLILATEENIKKICQFLNIEFSLKMLKYYKTDKKVDTWQKNIIRPPDPSQLYKWKKNMSQTDIIKADFICHKLARIFNYSPVYTNYSVFLTISILPFRLYGKLINFLEKVFFIIIPLKLRSFILKQYRMRTKTLTERVSKKMDL